MDVDGESTNDQSSSVSASSSKQVSRPIKLGKQIPGLSKQAVSQWLTLTAQLVDGGYLDYLDGKYGRIAEYVLARVACSGDVKALDLYLKRVDARRMERDKPDRPKPVGTVAFLPARATASDLDPTASSEPDPTASDSASNGAIESYDAIEPAKASDRS